MGTSPWKAATVIAIAVVVGVAWFAAGVVGSSGKPDLGEVVIVRSTTTVSTSTVATTTTTTRRSGTTNQTATSQPASTSPPTPSPPPSTTSPGAITVAPPTTICIAGDAPEPHDEADEADDPCD